MNKLLVYVLLLMSPVIGIQYDVNNMLVKFLLLDERPSKLLAPNLCWDRYQTTSLAKTLTKFGLEIATSLQENREEFYLQHLVLLVDLHCPGTNEFLRKASQDGYFKSPYRWIILEDSGAKGFAILDEIDVLVDSDVVLVQRVNDKQIDFVEVYKIAPNSNLIYQVRASWSLANLTGKSQYNYNALRREVKFNSSNNEYADKKVVVMKYDKIKDYRKTKVLSIRRMDLRGHTLVMVNVITDSNNTINHMNDRLYLHQDSITKMSYGVVTICFEMLNATEKLLFTHTWGYKDKNGSWQGIIDHLIKNKADLGSLTIFTQQRMEIIDYIAMVGSTAVRFVFREPPLSLMSNIFIQPFYWTVWVAIVVCVLGCSVFLYITSKWEATICTHQFQLNGTWADIVILTIGAVLQQGCSLEPRYASGRTVTLLLFMALTILYAAYAANIVVLLRAPSSSIRTLPDLLNSPLKMGASDFEYNRYFFKQLKEPIRKAIYDKKIAPKGNKPNFYSMKDGVQRIRQGLFAFHMESNPGYRLIQETYHEDEKCDLVEIDYINEIDPWVPGQKRSPFKDLFKFNFIKIRESGIQSCLHRRLNIPRPRCSGSVSTFSSVGINDMYPAMMASLYGALLAPIVLLFEIVYFRLTTLRKRNKI